MRRIIGPDMEVCAVQGRRLCGRTEIGIGHAPARSVKGAQACLSAVPVKARQALGILFQRRESGKSPLDVSGPITEPEAEVIIVPVQTKQIHTDARDVYREVAVSRPCMAVEAESRSGPDDVHHVGMTALRTEDAQINIPVGLDQALSADRAKQGSSQRHQDQAGCAQPVDQRSGQAEGIWWQAGGLRLSRRTLSARTLYWKAEAKSPAK